MGPTVVVTETPTEATPNPTMATPSPTVVATPTPTIATTTQTPTVETESPTLATTTPSPTVTESPTLATQSPTMATTQTPTIAMATETPTLAITPSPTPQSPVADPQCYIAQCGCGPDFLRSWCHAQMHQLHGWCVQSEQNCLACAGTWCPAGGVVTTPSASTTLPPTTASPTTGSPTTSSPVVGYEYEDMNLGTKTCRNNERIERLCLGRNSCSQSTCQTYCDENEECMFYFYNTRGRCHLYRSCFRRRRPSTSGVTMAKLFETTSTTETSTSTTEISTTPSGD